MQKGCRWCPFPGEAGPAEDVIGLLLMSCLPQGWLLGVLPKPLEAQAAAFPCVHIPMIDLLYKTCTVICVERLAAGVNRLFTDIHAPMYREFGEAPPLGLREDVGMDPNLGLRFPLRCVGSGQELPQLSRSLCLHPLQLGRAFFSCITRGDER